MFKSILDRLNEPSTHAGIATIALALSAFLPQYAMILQGVAVAFGGAGILKREGK